MKTAISLPDELYEAGEKARGKLGISRSRLYAEALRRYLETLDVRTESGQAAEDAAGYAEGGPESSNRTLTDVLKRNDEYRLDRAIAEFYGYDAPPVDPAGMAAQVKILGKEDW